MLSVHSANRDVVALQLLGQLSLTAPPSASPELRQRVETVNARRRVVALLAMLAVSPRPLSREFLADVFWRDSEPVKARHSLADALSTIRSVLGKESLEAHATEVALAASAPLVIDVRAFRDAMAAGDHASALARYTGDFLDGVYIDRAPRFEEWAALQRDQLRTQLVLACRAEHERLTANASHDDAATVAATWLQAEPLDADAALAWLSALVAPGTREALHHARDRYEAWRTQFHAEFEMEPEPDVVAFMRSVEASLATLRSPQAPADRTPQDPLHVEAGASAHPPTSPGMGGPFASGEHEAPAPLAPPSRTRASYTFFSLVTGKQLMGAAAIAALLMVGSAWRIGWWGVTFDPTVRGTRTAPVTVVVADAEHAPGDSSLAGAVTLAVRTALSGSEIARVLPEERVRDLWRLSRPDTSAPPDRARGEVTEGVATLIAARAGAGAVLVPVVAGVGPRYLLAFRLLRASDGLEIVTLKGEPVDSTALLRSLDRLTRSALRRFGASRAQIAATVPLPDFTTASLPALQALSEGLTAFNGSRLDLAWAAYRRAVELDPSFAMAWSALGSVEAFSNRPLAAESAFVQVEQHIGRLSERERVLTRANMARWRGQRRQAIAIRSEWLTRRPTDHGMWAAQGYDLLQDRQYDRAAEALTRVLAVDSTNATAWRNLGLAYKGIDTAGFTRAVSAYARALRLDPAMGRDPFIYGEYGGLLVEAGQVDSARRIFALAPASSPSLRGRALRALGMLELWRGDAAAAARTFGDAVRASTESRESLSVMRSRLLLEMALRSAADTGGARLQRDSVRRDLASVREPVMLYWAGQRLARAGDVAGARTAARLVRERMIAGNPIHRAALQLLEGEIDVASGNASRGLAAIAEGMRGDSTTISMESLAYATWRAGRIPEARALYTAIANSRPTFSFEYEVARRMAVGMVPQVHAARVTDRPAPSQVPGYALPAVSWTVK